MTLKLEAEPPYDPLATDIARVANACALATVVTAGAVHAYAFGLATLSVTVRIRHVPRTVAASGFEIEVALASQTLEPFTFSPAWATTHEELTVGADPVTQSVGNVHGLGRWLSGLVSALHRVAAEREAESTFLAGLSESARAELRGPEES